MTRNARYAHAILAPLVLVAAALAGCADDGSFLSADAVEVTITDHPEAANASEEIYIAWDVTVVASGNGSTDAGAFDEVGLVYAGNASVSGGNVSDYPNATGQESNAEPGSFDATFIVDEPGTVYVRAYATLGEHTKFSDAVAIEVGGGGSGENTTVTIRDAQLAHLSGFDPEVVTVSAGDSVVWHNEDDATHTATGDGFDTGDIAGGEYSEPIVFDEPGEYAYQCRYHPQTMQGTIVVEDANATPA